MRCLEGFSIVEAVISLLILTIVWVVSSEMIIQSNKLTVDTELSCSNSLRSEVLSQLNSMGLRNGEKIVICEKVYLIEIERKGGFQIITIHEPDESKNDPVKFFSYNNEN